MNVRFTGRNVGISEEDRAWAWKKAEALTRYNRGLQVMEIRVEMDGGLLEKVEIEASLGHQHRAVAIGEAQQFRAAFDRAADSLKRQLLKDKERVVDRRRRSAARKKGTEGKGR